MFVGQSCCFSLWQVGFLGEDEAAFQARRPLSKYQIQKYRTLEILNTGVKDFNNITAVQKSAQI